MHSLIHTTVGRALRSGIFLWRIAYGRIGLSRQRPKPYTRSAEMSLIVRC